MPSAAVLACGHNYPKRNRSGTAYRHRIPPWPHPAEYIDALIEGLKKYCRGVIAITGVRPDAENVGVAALDTATGAGCVATRPVAPGIFYGTGDIFASAFSALIVRGADLNAATDTALSLVGESIDLTVKRGRPRRFGVDFEFAMINYVNRS